jgi:hypothetical protein
MIFNTNSYIIGESVDSHMHVILFSLMNL